jgi:hypothetical protein
MAKPLMPRDLIGLTTMEPTYDIMRLFDDMGLQGAVVCRHCGSLVFVEVGRMRQHADLETNYRWRVELPSWATGYPVA